MGEEGGVPVAVVRPVVTNGEGLRGLEAVCGKLCCEVVLRVQEGGVLEVNRHGVALQDLCCLLGPPRTLLLHNYLVDTRKSKREAAVRVHGH